MVENIEENKELTEMHMEAAIEHLTGELMSVRAGKASPAMLRNITVDYYGTQTPLNQVANVNISDARTLVVKPWEKSMLQPIEKAIFASNLGITPQSDGEVIRIVLPMLTEERRKDLAKQIRAMGEHAKISIRHARHDANKNIKHLVSKGLSEDLGKDAEGEIMDLTKKYGGKVDHLIAAKEKELMTI